MSISFRPLTPSQEWSNDRWVGPSGSSSSIPSLYLPEAVHEALREAAFHEQRASLLEGCQQPCRVVSPKPS